MKLLLASLRGGHAHLIRCAVNTDGFVGDKGRVTLLFGGRALSDTKQLHDYGIAGNSVLAHVVPLSTTFDAPTEERIDYTRLADLLAQAHAAALGGRHADPTDFAVAEGGSWDPKWGGGNAWRSLPPVIVGDTGLTRDEVIEESGEDGLDAYGRWALRETWARARLLTSVLCPPRAHAPADRQRDAARVGWHCRPCSGCGSGAVARCRVSEPQRRP